MKRFAALYRELDRSTATNDKRAALIRYFRQAPPLDAAWAIFLLCGGKINGARQRIASSGELRRWISELTTLPDWLVDDSYEQVGDLAETLALLLDDPLVSGTDLSLSEWIEQRLLPIANEPEALRREQVIGAWQTLLFEQRLLFNKLLTGALRVGVSQRLVQQALAEWSGIDIARIAQRMLGQWTPSQALLPRLLSETELPGDRQQPYPFFLASPLEGAAQTLGAIEDWLLEWKWDGIRLQLLRRDGNVALWSRGEERLDGRFPEIEAAAMGLPDGSVIDGELLIWHEGEPLPMAFGALQTRIQRRRPGPKTLRDTPARLLAYDLLEHAGQDLRQQPLQQRRAQLRRLLGTLDDAHIQLSPPLAAADWNAAAQLRDAARSRAVEGLMLKRNASAYQQGRRRGDWWKWKVDPLTIDAVMIYAQAGHGRRSTLYTDYTFALWDGGRLVPVAKAYSGLDDAEILSLDRWIRGHTTERFGPVRSVVAEQVFELGFEAVNRSNRHKSGIAVRFPRILRWRHDKSAADADQLQTLQALAR